MIMNNDFNIYMEQLQFFMALYTPVHDVDPHMYFGDTITVTTFQFTEKPANILLF